MSYSAHGFLAALLGVTLVLAPMAIAVGWNAAKRADHRRGVRPEKGGA